MSGEIGYIDVSTVLIVTLVRVDEVRVYIESRSVEIIRCAVQEAVRELISSSVMQLPSGGLLA